MLRVATFNLKHGAPEHRYWAKLKGLKEACKAFEDVDILALQEVDKRAARSGFRNLAKLVAKATDMQVVFAPTRSRPTGGYGNALLVRGEIEEPDILELGGGPRFKLTALGRKLPPFGYEPRTAIVATARLGERRYSVAATHLSLERNIRGAQLTQVLGALATRPEPRILIGDLNQVTRSLFMQPMPRTMTLAEGYATTPASEPRRQVDHIIVQGLEIGAVETRHLPIGDHLALFADVN